MISRRPFVEFGLILAALCAVSVPVLLDLARLSGSEELYSHLPLIPLIVGYLIWINRNDLVHLHPALGTRAWLPAGVAALLGVGLVLGYWVALGNGWKPAAHDRLAVLMAGFLCWVWCGTFVTLGAGFVRAMLFPLGFLVFIVPFPTFAIDGINWFFQHLSAEAAYWMLKIPGTPIFRTGLVMQMPGITIEVAEECSGIRSTLVLFITSLMGGYMFLKRPWHRFWFAAAIVPLAILRNGFRIFTISMLSVHIDPSMINSWIHKKGGPVFFAISLVPLFLLLAWFRKREGKGRVESTANGR